MNSCLDYVLVVTKWLFLSSYDVISHSYLPSCYRVIINLVVPLTDLAALNTRHMRVLYGGRGIYGGCRSKAIALMGSLNHWMYGSLV
jgi:hypothetical protein